MNFKDSKTIYEQIADRLCDEILQGRYVADERVPSVREYAALVEVNVNTVVKSYDFLTSSGIIYNKRGLGYFVAADAAEVILRIRKDEFMNESIPEFFHRLRMLGISWDEIKAVYDGLYPEKNEMQ